ncbi:MAG: PorT family protein [Mediterranea sp.]|jgi:hypothetical protein|nr:PorT family protein [Mediterranea sp.]
MKKVLFISLLLVSVGISSYARNFKAGVTAGLNVSSPSDYDSRMGFNVGVKGELGLPNVSEGLYLDFGVLLSSQGWESSKYYDARKKQGMQWKGNPYFLNIPVHVGYKLPVGSNTNLFAHIGPYIGIGLFGKNKLVTETANGKKTTTTQADNVFSDRQSERFDWGIGGKAGVEFAGHFQVALGYDWGMRNLKTSKNPVDFKNRVFSVSCAYMF